MTQPKVVSLTTRIKKRMTVPPILHSVRQHAKKQLIQLLNGLFNNVDDALFEMADRSQNNSDLYFDSMRKIRLHRTSIVSTFGDEFSNGFDQLLEVRKNPDDPVDFDDAVDNFSLLQNDELEINVAISGITSKVTGQHDLSITLLTRRFDHVCKLQNKDIDVLDRLNPLGPELLSQAFVSGISCLDIDIKVRIILLKLFERYVMERLAGVYHDANQLFADGDILPDLKDVVRRKRSNPTGSGPAAVDQVSNPSGIPTHSHEEQVSEASFGLIQTLLAASRGGHVPTSESREPALPTQDLVSLLSAAQTDLDTSPINIEQIPPLLDLQKLVAARANELMGENRSRMAQGDHDVVNFVGMLFDYILNDRNLAIPMKALIGRLQLPIVKLAIMDKTFFEKSSHPARLMLNELSSAGIGWSSAGELKRDALYNTIESIVLRVMNGFTDNQDIFAVLVEELRDFVSRDRKKPDQLEERVKAAETGKARTIEAKLTVQKLINHKASGVRLPPEVGRFISDTWSKLLVYACVSQGVDSPLWQQSVQTLDDLLWCLQPLDTTADIDKRDTMLEPLLEGLADGMQVIEILGGAKSELTDRIYKHLHEISVNDRNFLEDDVELNVDSEYEEMGEIVLAAPESLDPADTVPPEPKFMEQINRLTEGMWVEMTQENGEKLRCKLTAIVEPGPRYVFVNRRGMKVVEKSRIGLANELKRKALTVLQESQVFDRALQAVIGNLRQMHRDTSGSRI